MKVLTIKMSEYSKEVKSRYIKPFSYILAAMALVNSYIYFSIYRSLVLSTICFLCATAAFMLPFITKRTNSHVFVANYTVMVMFVCVTSLGVYTGGIMSNAIWWLGTLPLLASFLLNAFAGLIWFLIVMAVFIFIFFLGTIGALPLNVLHDASPVGRMFVSFTLNAGLITFLCILADSIRDEAFLEKEELRLKTFQLNQLASLGKMASGVAHEINNPLTVVRGAQLRILRMIQSPEPIDKEVLAEYMGKVHRNILRIQDVTGLLGTISEKARDRTISKIDTKNMIEDVIQMRTEDLHRYNITLITTFPEESQLFSGIFSEMFQAFLNIFDNAIYELKNSSDQSKILKVDLQAQEKFIVVTFEDNGSGIPSHLKQRVFDPFYRSKNFDDHKGLGLSFSYNVILANHGTLDLLNTAKGSIFQITLPKA